MPVDGNARLVALVARVFLVGALTLLSCFSTVAVTAVAATRGKTPRPADGRSNDFALAQLARDL